MPPNKFGCTFNIVHVDKVHRKKREFVKDSSGWDDLVAFVQKQFETTRRDFTIRVKDEGQQFDLGEWEDLEPFVEKKDLVIEVQRESGDADQLKLQILDSIARRASQFDYKKFGERGLLLAKQLKEKAAQYDKCSFDVAVARSSGGIASFCGGVVATVGVAAALPSAGASLALVVVGGSLMGAGGITSVGSSIGKLHHDRTTACVEDEAKSYIDDFKRHIFDWQTLEDYAVKLEEEKKKPRQYGKAGATTSLGASVVTSVVSASAFPKLALVTEALQLASAKTVGNGISQMTIASGKIAFATPLRVCGTVGCVFATLVGIYDLVDSIKDLDKAHARAARLREVAKKIEEFAPTLSTVDGFKLRSFAYF